MDLQTKSIVLPISNSVCIIQEADGFADKILFSKKFNLHKTYPDYWAYCTKTIDGKKPTAQDIKRLLIPDQQYLAIEIYKLSYGDEMELKTACTACGKPIGVTVNLAELEIRPLPEGANPPDPSYEVKLPRTKRKVTFGYITYEKDMDDVDSDYNPTRTVFKFIRSIDGQPPVYEEVQKLPVRDLKYLREAMLTKATGYKTTVDVKCSHCDKEIEVNILVDVSFLFGGLG